MTTTEKARALLKPENRRFVATALQRQLCSASRQDGARRGGEHDVAKRPLAYVDAQDVGHCARACAGPTGTSRGGRGTAGRRTQDA